MLTRLPSAPSAQRGITLVSILIGLFIALLVSGMMLSFVKVYLGYQNQIADQTEMAQAEQNIDRFVNNTLAQAGGSDSGTPVSAYLTGTEGSGIDNSDVLNFRLWGNVANSSQDCDGNSVPANVVSSWQTLAIDSKYNLYCNGKTIASNVANMQVLYGVANGSDQKVNWYTSANDANMDKVVSLRLGFLIYASSINPSLSASTVDLLGQTVSTPANHSYTAHVITVQLRQSRL
jgi:hypothetical protein